MSTPSERPPSIWAIAANPDRHFSYDIRSLSPGALLRWRVPKNSRAGDLFLLWVSKTGFLFILEGVSTPLRSKDGPDHLELRVLRRLSTAVNIADLRADRVLSKWPPVKGNMLGLRSMQREGIEKNVAVWSALKELILARDAEAVELLRPLGAATPDDAGIPAELVKACVAGQCVLFAGLGLNERAGLPDGKKLAFGLLDWAAKRESLDPKLRASLLPLADQGQSDLVLEGVVEGSDDGHTVAIDYLRKSLSWSNTKPLDSLGPLRSIGFAGLVTSNLDDLLERSLQVPEERLYTLNDGERLLQAQNKGEFLLLKLYGRLDRPETVHLTPARYRDAVVGNVPFGQFLSALFYSRTLLFVGKDLKGIEDFLASVPSRSGNPPAHFALVSDDEPGWQVKATSLKRRFGLELLVRSRQKAGPADFLAALGEKVKRERSAVTPPRAHDPSRIAKVALENIGPFETLELDMDPAWNVFLGDNGVGKSSVIRAIAVGAIGEDAARFAGRLLRSGRTSGSITLVTNRGTSYRTELHATSTGGLRLSSVPPVRAVDAEHWLALGFPALRTVGAGASEGYERSAGGTTFAEDLLPLVRGEPDPRLSKLKAWILHLDHMNKEQAARKGGGSERYARLLEEFFRLVEQAATGVRVTLDRIDARAKQVYVMTHDGSVPLEAVSQGTQSLMGWVGVLLQRMWEFYDNEENPTGRPALVLMDEMDAHMHPAWQYSMVKTLRTMFPGVQFIATTHSALLLAGLRKEQVYALRRDPETRQVVPSRTREDFSDMRADQILLSPLFGLPSTLGDGLARKIARYSELLGMASREEKLETEFETLRAELQDKLSYGETPVQKQVEQAIQKALPIPADIPKDMELEIKRRLAELSKQEARS